MFCLGHLFTAFQTSGTFTPPAARFRVKRCYLSLSGEHSPIIDIIPRLFYFYREVVAVRGAGIIKKCQQETHDTAPLKGVGQNQCGKNSVNKNSFVIGL